MPCHGDYKCVKSKSTVIFFGDWVWREREKTSTGPSNTTQLFLEGPTQYALNTHYSCLILLTETILE